MDELRRAERAKALINDPLFKEAFDVLHSAQIGIFTGDLCNSEQLMEAHRMVRALHMLKQQLENVIVTGKLLERQQQKGQHRG
jgi:hypothetical protein